MPTPHHHSLSAGGFFGEACRWRRRAAGTTLNAGSDGRKGGSRGAIVVTSRRYPAMTAKLAAEMTKPAVIPCLPVHRIDGCVDGFNALEIHGHERIDVRSLGHRLGITGLRIFLLGIFLFRIFLFRIFLFRIFLLGVLLLQVFLFGIFLFRFLVLVFFLCRRPFPFLLLLPSRGPFPSPVPCRPFSPFRVPSFPPRFPSGIKVVAADQVAGPRVDGALNGAVIEVHVGVDGHTLILEQLHELIERADLLVGALATSAAGRTS